MQSIVLNASSTDTRNEAAINEACPRFTEREMHGLAMIALRNKLKSATRISMWMFSLAVDRLYRINLRI